jgi:N-acetylmuramoyl-L-alanine amidase
MPPRTLTGDPAWKENLVRLILSSIVLCLLLLVSPLPAASKSIGKPEVNVRSGPGLQQKILFKAPLGYPVEVEKIKGDWVYFRDWVNKRGWVHKDLISEVQTAVITVKKANVRSGPGAKSSVVAEVSEGEIYKILERSGEWVKIGYYEGSAPLGWIRRDLVFGD